MDFKYTGLAMSVINTYAPTALAERVAFFSAELPWEFDVGGYIIMAGDFNCVTRADDADPRSLPGEPWLSGRDLLEALMATLKLDNAWRLLQVQCPVDGHTLIWTSRDRTSARAHLDHRLTPVDREWVAGSRQSMCTSVGPTVFCHR